MTLELLLDLGLGAVVLALSGAWGKVMKLYRDPELTILAKLVCALDWGVNLVLLGLGAVVVWVVAGQLWRALYSALVAK